MTMTAPTPATIAKPRALPRAKPVREDAYRRGEIWMVVSDPTAPPVGTEIWSNRPAIVLSNNVHNARSGFAQVVYLSTATRKRSGPSHVEVPAPDGNGMAMALCEQIHTVDASRLRRKMSTVPHEYLRELDAAVALSLSLGRNPDTHSAFRKWEEHIKVHGVDLAKEIAALAGQTADDRVVSLTRALELVASEADSWKTLYEASQTRTAVLDDVNAALGAASSV